MRLTGLGKDELYALLRSGALPAHKAPKSGWRIALEDLASSGLVREQEESVPGTDGSGNTVTYVADDQHFTLVFKRMAEVTGSLKIATANLKNFSVSVGDGGDDTTMRLCDFFLSLVERGVHVQIVCMKPFGFYLYAREKCPALLANPLFELRCNEHNHMKIFIFDDECAYVGSANITDAAIGKRAGGRRNHEAGMLVRGKELMEMPLGHFDRVWNDPDALKHTWKRFASKAKELDKELRERYGK